MSQQGRLIDQDLETLEGDTGGPVSPDGSGNINVIGGSGTVTVTGNPGTHTLTIETSNDGYPITPYVVGAAGIAGYQTVQSAINAAQALGSDATIYIQPGTYTEDLTLYDGIDIVGSIYTGTTIVGTHTPPTSGNVQFQDITLESATHVFNSAAAGTTNISVVDCEVNVTNGYLFNLLNWTGTLEVGETGFVGTNDGFVNNTGGATIVCNATEVGIGSGNEAIMSGTLILYNTYFLCPIDFQTGSDIKADGCRFEQTVTLSNNSTGYFRECNFDTGANSAVSHGSSAAVSISNSTIDSSNSPAIDGAGAGVLTLTGVDFIDNTNIAGTLTVASGITYSGTYKSDYTDHGILLGQGSVSNIVATTAGTNGQLLIGATGADPAFASLTSTGSTIDFTAGANTLNLETSGSIATTFNADTGSATPSLGVLTVTGSKGITTSATGSTITIIGSGEKEIDITSLSDADSPYTVLSTDYYMSCDVSLGVLTINLPDAPTTGRVYIVKDSGGDANTNNITVTTVSGVVTIDGSISRVMSTDYENLQFVFNGTSYEVF
jgi:hypothetical protein